MFSRFRPLVAFKQARFASQFRHGVDPRRFNAFNRQQTVDIVLYASSAILGLVGLTYAAVPLYRLFCQATGLGGTPMTDSSKFTPDKMQPKKGARKIRISFNADTSVTMKWKFRPQQSEVVVAPGETSLIFYTAENPTQEDIIGVSTYNVVPLKAGAYFNKIQCFCFEEQKLKAGEQVDMPVFFFIDPDFDDDPQMDDVHEITLSYTFFNARAGLPYRPGATASPSSVQSVSAQVQT